MIEIWAILQKDLRSEYRTRYAVNSLILFALVTLAAMSLATGGAMATPLLASVFFWIILFFSALSSLAQTFIKETETKTSTFLKLTAPTDAVYFGKWLFNLLLVFLLEAILTPLFMVFLGVTIHRWDVWLSTLALGGIGLVSTVTLLGALIAAANVRGALFSVLALPVLLPLLVTLIRATEASLFAGSATDVSEYELVMAAYAGVATTAGWLLFPFVWRE